MAGKKSYEAPLITRLQFSADTKVSLLNGCKNAGSINGSSNPHCLDQNFSQSCQAVGS
jgi:hypothetical protein